MTTRSCAACGEEKAVSGIWYLLAHSAGQFMCSSCYTEGRFEALETA